MLDYLCNESLIGYYIYIWYENINFVIFHINWYHDLSYDKIIKLWSFYSISDQRLIKLPSNFNDDLVNLGLTPIAKRAKMSSIKSLSKEKIY